ncbi:MAG: ArsR family transcriptional regulator [Akkermansiaceae bacterium]|nr:ArsR family transcriptional regulator [Akkermansiaceae bacterium]NNM30686.1 ArsR family transcriptional regulator [Akkermansiaceae bacterium]
MIDFSKLDKVIHEKGRLAIMSLLASRGEAWAFQDLKSELEMSDGNLITHLRSLAKAGYVESERLESETRPQTYYGLTKAGRKAFEEYLKVLEEILDLNR